MAHIKKIDEMARQTVSLRSDSLFKKAFEVFEKELKELLAKNNNIILMQSDIDGTVDAIAVFCAVFCDGYALVSTENIDAIRLNNGEIEILCGNNGFTEDEIEDILKIDDDEWISLNDNDSDLMPWETLLSIYTNISNRSDL